MPTALDAVVAVTPATSLVAALGLAGGGYLDGREDIAACGAVVGAFGLAVERLQTRRVRVRLRRERAEHRSDLAEVTRVLQEMRRDLASLRTDLDDVRAERDAVREELVAARHHAAPMTGAFATPVPAAAAATVIPPVVPPAPAAPPVPMPAPAAVGAPAVPSAVAVPVVTGTPVVASAPAATTAAASAAPEASSAAVPVAGAEPVPVVPAVPVVDLRERDDTAPVVIELDGAGTAVRRSGEDRPRARQSGPGAGEPRLPLSLILPGQVRSPIATGGIPLLAPGPSLPVRPVPDLASGRSGRLDPAGRDHRDDETQPLPVITAELADAMVYAAMAEADAAELTRALDPASAGALHTGDAHHAGDYSRDELELVPRPAAPTLYVVRRGKHVA